MTLTAALLIMSLSQKTAQPQKVTEINLDGEVIEGTLKAPDLEGIEVRKQSTFKSLITRA